MAAEFKISRLKYNWQGQWQDATVYNPDDVVSVSGKVYACLVRHTSDSVFYTDLLFENNDVPPVAEPKWELIADGVNFVGDWTVDTEYFIGDIVKVGGVVYICLEGHFSSVTEAGFATDYLTNNYWSVFFNSVKWEQNWTTATLYKVGDVVKYSGNLYVCNTLHLSSSLANPGLIADIGKWDVFSLNVAWKSVWTASTIYYLNDIVRYGGNLYKCINQHLSASTAVDGLELNLADWQVFLLGIEYKGSWTDNFRYKANDIVKYGSTLYKCNLGHNVAVSASFDSTKWDVYVPGQEFETAWSSGSLYQPGDIVKHGGFLYASTTTNLASEPDWDQNNVNPNWNLLFDGNRFRNEWSAAVTYKAGDVVRRNGQLYFAKRNVSVGNDVDIIDDGSSINSDDWELLVPGTQWHGIWTQEVEFFIGDVVLWKGSSFKCLVRHISSLANRPDTLFGLGTQWEEYAFGNENNVLAFVGDIKKFGVSTTERVAIGNEGQALRATDNNPEWSYFNQSENVYFVSQNGVDAPHRGTTLNSAYRTLRYALDNLKRYKANAQALTQALLRYSVAGTVENAPNLTNLIESMNGSFMYGDFNEDGDITSYEALVMLQYFNGNTTAYSDKTLSRILDLINAFESNIDLYLEEYQVNAGVTYPMVTEDVSKGATVFVKTGTFEEILPLRVPANVAIVGDELRMSVVKPVENYFTSTDIDRYENIVDFINTFVGSLLTGVTITGKLGSVDQSTVAPFATSTETTFITNRLSLIKTGMTTLNAGSITSTNTLTSVENSLKAARQLYNNIEFIQSEAKAYLAVNYPSYSYVESVLDSAIKRIIEAVIYDIKYTGNYKSLETGKFFYNASNAAQNKLENMFLLRDGTGLRNCTLVGLEGTLGNLNTNLTRRPTAGAYASLDAGWGVTDSTAWVGNRSPYVQNVTTFGTACVGLKVDGSLHSGGNKTIVANDFTQVLSDGIGVWANADGGTEVVSIFTYYNHIGYLCTDGGKIRGTNGNCSYGTYGAVAEGFNLSENVVTGTVNNRYYDATVGQTFTNGTNIQKLFYSHAGQDYTTATYSVTGAGINASLLADEFRDGGVNHVRLVNANDSTDPRGLGYSLNINNAQSGNEVSITLAASTDVTEANLRNLRIVINSGTGSGQYGYIADYNNTSKIVLVGREDLEPLTVTTTQTGTNLLTISSTPIHLRAGEKVCFTGTVFGGISANTIYVVSSLVGNTITLTDELSVPITLSNASGNMQVHRLGWNHWQQGTVLEPILDTTTRYFIEPRLVFSNPTRTSTAGSLPDNDAWTGVTYGNGVWVAVNEGPNNNGEYVNYSVDGTTWIQSPLPIGGWSAVTYGNGKFVAVAKDGKVAYSSNGINWTAGTIPVAEYRAVVYGDGYYIAVASGGNQAARSTNGITWSSVTLPEGADWSGIAYGKGTFVAVSQGDSSSANIAYSTNAGASWTLSSIPGGAKMVAYGNNRFVIMAGGYAGANDTFISFDGITWQAGSVDSAEWTALTYGQGMFVATSSFENFVAYSIDGLKWRMLELDNSVDWSAIAFGKNNTEGFFIAVAKDSDIISKIALGTRAEARVSLDANKITNILIFEPGSGYSTAPTMTIVDPVNTVEAASTVFIGDGVLAGPTILNSGQGWLTVSTRISITGDGFKDEFQIGNELIVDNVNLIPGPGDNLRITGIDDYVYKVLSAEVLSGTVGDFLLRLVITKALQSNESPTHGTAITIRQLYSQVRLTGHDFLDIGLGNFAQTNYPDTLNPVGTLVSPENEIKEADGGRVFYTSTDQDGNFRVGELFAVEQSTGTVTINAEFFELEGLEELRLGGVSVGGTGVVIREFSTDPLFVADSNNIIPTQKAIKEYIARRVSGGGSDAFTGQFTAGVITVGPARITTTTLEQINIPVKVNFKAPVAGKMLAMSYFVNSNTEDVGEVNQGQ